jgi:DNA helicase-2/ATP-dependent DNA helicase PcrA
MMIYSPAKLAEALGLPAPTEEQAAVIAAPPGPLVVIAGAGAGKTETMAARVVWLVANGIAEPGQVLGLTFTRKAAGQLLRRVRSRLARLAGHLGGDVSAGAPTVSTYHAFAGSLLRDHGVLLPIEPDVRLLTPTELWQLAYDVIKTYPGRLDTDKSPARITDMVLRLSGELAEHLVDTDQLLDSHTELERLAYHLPPGRHQRADGPNQWLRNVLDVQTQRTTLIPLIDALHARMHDEKVMDFGAQMGAAARLAARCPQVGAELRSRYRVVLLDEYQDTGHAQRIMLSSLFGGGVDPDLALTAVGDPIQSIYGWRGASAANLPRFATDFPHADGTPAPTLELLTSWRNPPSALHIANAISAEARQRSVIVRPLRPRPGAGQGTVKCALWNDIDAERDWLADQIADRYRSAVEAGEQPPTAAVLLRRNADAGPIAQALTRRGIPVEVVGLSGLLSIPEVADVVAMLRLVADPTAGSAAIRVLTGPRWRLGAHDIVALWRRATALRGSQSESGTTDAIVASAAPDADAACLADALADPGPATQYSPEGYRRITAVSAELTWLRGYLTHPVTELLAEVRRVLGVDVEVRANRPAVSAWSGTEHLDKLAEVVADYADHSNASVSGLLDYLTVAETVEKGLAPAEINVVADRVQILTVHAAKGLEWEMVAIPHVSGRIFPSAGVSARTWLSDAAALPPLLRGDRAADGVHGVPVLETDSVTDRKALADKIMAHRDVLERRRIDEERRLLYVAVTRSEDTLLISGHHWGPTGSKPSGPSDFLCEIKDIIEASAATGEPVGEVVEWAAEPADGERNPLRESVNEMLWPRDPLGSRRSQVERGAALVTAARDIADGADAQDDPECWITAVDALIAERNREPSANGAELPGLLSVSSLVELRRDRAAAVRRLTRRLPSRPDAHAILGTAFHQWVQRFYGTERLFDLEDLPGAADSDPAGGAALAELQEAFIASKWATRTPIDVEVSFEMAIGDSIVRGRIDAVFADADGGMTVVDWKTGAAPVDPEECRNAALQLGVYRLAWAALRGCPETEVRAAFHYVRSGRTVVPETMPGPEELVELLADREINAEPRAESPALS